MGNAIGQMLPFAVGVAISPMPIVAVILMLVSARAKVNGTAFLGGWIVGLTVVGGIVLAISGSGGANDNGEPATWVNILKVVLGVLLVLVAVKNWRTRPQQGEEPPMPKWMAAVEGFTPVKSAGVAFLLAGVNPKNLLLTVGAAAAIAQTGISGAEQVLTLAIFIVIASVGVAAPVVIYFAMGQKAAEILDDLKTWMAHNNTVIMAVLCLVIGVKLIGDAISGFSM